MLSGLQRDEPVYRRGGHGSRLWAGPCADLPHARGGHLHDLRKRPGERDRVRGDGAGAGPALDPHAGDREERVRLHGDLQLLRGRDRDEGRLAGDHQGGPEDARLRSAKHPLRGGQVRWIHHL